MHFKKIIPVRAVLLTGFLLWTGSVFAFEYAGQAWCCDTVYYFVNEINPSSQCGSGFGLTFHAWINSAAWTWNEMGTHFQLVDAGSTSISCYSSGNLCQGYKDGQNTVSMAAGCSWSDNNIIAYATWWYWTGGDTAGCIFESDICFNDNVTWYTMFQGCTGNCYDLKSVATHELGHWIASNHENHDAVLGYKPIMYYAFNYCEQRRTITPDDSALVGWAYDWLGSIALPYRSNVVHYHPPYPSPLPRDTCLILDAVVCEPQGSGTTHPPDYWYDVTPGDLGRCDFHIKVFDSVAGDYTNWVEPTNWTHQLHKVGNDWWVSWWNNGCTNAIFNTFRFQFDNPNAAGWGDWTTTISGNINPFIQILDSCGHHSAQPDGYGFRVHVPLASCCILRGDADRSGAINVADLTYLVDFLFKGGPAPPCLDEGDVDGSGGLINVADLTYLVDYLFNGGPAPPPC